MLPPRRPLRGFTLLELLIVIAIILFILSTLVLSAAYFMQRGRATNTQTVLARISVAMQQYRQMHGSYPGMAGGKFTEKWPADYDPRGVEFELTLLAGVDLNLPDQNRDAERRYVLDGWRQPLRYRRSSPETILVWSVGPDKIDQTGAQGPLKNEAAGDDLATH